MVLENIDLLVHAYERTPHARTCNARVTGDNEIPAKDFVFARTENLIHIGWAHQKNLLVKELDISRLQNVHDGDIQSNLEYSRIYWGQVGEGRGKLEISNTISQMGLIVQQ